MCGRFDQSHTKLEYAMAMGWPVNELNGDSQAEPRRNVSPGTYRPVLHLAEGVPSVDDLHWGYRPIWAAGKVPIAMNARLEKITNGYWRKLLASGRCIAAADGWYEWTGEKGSKLPWHIHLKTREPIFMAAIGNFGPFKEHKAEAGFAIVTDDAVGGMLDVHDRRPIVLRPEDALTWVSKDMSADEAAEFLRIASRPTEDFEWHRVSTAVNKAGTEAPDLTEPIEQFPAAPD
jgi:putative SOS response-associated peptidase YedK